MRENGKIPRCEQPTVLRCMTCLAVLSWFDGVPKLDDDKGWAAMAREHAPGCEWILTRAHRRPGAEEG